MDPARAIRIRAASAALTCGCLALALVGCASAISAGSASPSASPAAASPATGEGSSAAPSPTAPLGFAGGQAPSASHEASSSPSQPGSPESSGDGESTEPVPPSSSDDDGGTGRQPQQIPGKQPRVDPATVAGGPAVVRVEGRLYLAVATPNGCAPLLGGTERDEDEWVVSLVEQPGGSCSSDMKVATFALPTDDEPAEVVVEIGDQRERVQVP